MYVLSDRIAMLILGVLCILFSACLFYGATRRDYYLRIDTVDMVRSLTGWNELVSLAGAMGLSLIVFALGLFLIFFRPRS